VSEVPIDGDELRGEAADVTKLLALHGLRRGLESEPAVQLGAEVVAKMTRDELVETKTTIVQLSELIAAIDRRLPQVQRAGEAAIANAAMHLKSEAAKRIVELKAEVAGREFTNPQPATT
jgi:hypothetical protein